MFLRPGQMTGKHPAPPKGPPDNPPGCNSECRTPNWMRNSDEMGQTVVLVLRRKTDDNETSAGKIEARLPEPFVIGSSVQLILGVNESRKVTVSRKGRGTRYLLRTNLRSIVDKLTSLTELSDGTKIEISLHPTLNTVQGTVYEPDSINTDEKLICEHLSSQGVQAVRRIKKRVNGDLVNTPLLVLTFHGTVLPDHVYFGLLRIPVRTYYPSPLLCHNCGMYGHSRKFCQQPGVCMRCSQLIHVPDGEQCNNSPYCMHCKNDHTVTSRDCPKYKEEDKIVHMKVDQCISYSEARRRYTMENKRETIARVIQDQLKQEIVAKDQTIAKLLKQVADLTKELASLKSSIEPHPGKSPSFSQDTQTQHPASIRSTEAGPSKKTTRESRKDTVFIPPPTRKDNRDNDPDNIIRTRSRSGKRQFEISPTDTNNSRGKRLSTNIETYHVRSASKNDG